MFKKALLAVIAVFLAWSVLDFVIHGVILKDAYASTPALWRPMAEMKMGLMHFTVLIAAICFVSIYARFVAGKSLKNAALFGLIFGMGTGISMGYGTYSVMPIPYHMALTWFLGSVVEATLGGLLMGLIIRK